jgi:hypothetical protein
VFNFQYQATPDYLSAPRGARKCRSIDADCGNNVFPGKTVGIFKDRGSFATLAAIRRASSRVSNCSFLFQLFTSTRRSASTRSNRQRSATPLQFHMAANRLIARHELFS